MKNILQRLKSPVVIVQLLSIVGATVVILVPGIDVAVEQIVAALAVIVNVFAGLNNPTDSAKF